MKNTLYTVIGPHRQGKHGSAYRWFKTRIEAERHAVSLATYSQVGRSWNGQEPTTKALKFFVVSTVGVIEVPTQRLSNRQLNDADIASMQLG